MLQMTAATTILSFLLKARKNTSLKLFSKQPHMKRKTPRVLRKPSGFLNFHLGHQAANSTNLIHSSMRSSTVWRNNLIR